MRLPSPIAALAAPLLLTVPAQAQLEYEVTIEGQVEFSLISTGPLAAITPGDAARLSFRLRDDDFIDSPSFPTRGYRIDPDSWVFDLPGGSIPLQSPYSAPELLFVIRDNDPAVDGFLVSSVVSFPSGVPLGVPGSFGAFENSFQVTYGGDLLPSLDIADAVGDYDFTGLTVFNWTIDDGPFNPVGLIFESLRVVPSVDASVTPYGCRVNPSGSLVPVSGSATIGDTLEVGIANPLGTQPAGALGLAFVGFGPDPAFPCGTPLPGFGMAGPGAPGELLLDLTGPLLTFPAAQPWAGPGTTADVALPFPNSASLAGVELFVQGALVDPLAQFGVPVGLTEALSIQLGS